MELDTRPTLFGALGIGAATTALLGEVADWTSPRVPELAAFWTRALHRSVGDGAPLHRLIADLVGLFAAYVGRGDFAGYFEEVARVGRSYAAEGLPYHDVQQMAVAWGKAGPSIVDRSIADPTRRREISLALDVISSRTLAVLAESYAAVALAERRALEALTEADPSPPDLAGLLQTLLARIVKAVEADTGAIRLLGEREAWLRPPVTFGLASGELEAGLGDDGEDFARLVVLTGQPKWMAGTSAGPAEISRSILGVPLQTDGQIVGVLQVGMRRQYQFSAQEVHLLEMLAARTATEIERFRIFERSQQQAQTLAEASAELQALDKLKSAFLGTVSHELRTPLTSVIGYIDMLQRGTEVLTPRQRHYLEVAGRNARDLLRLINELIGFATVEAGYVDVHPRPVALPPIVTRLLTTMLPRFEHKGVRLRWRLPRRLPQVVADAARLHESLDAVMTNALKFTDEGGTVVLLVELKEGPRGRQEVVISVRDTGIGIPAGQIERIWDRFYQVDPSSTRRHGGMGLGLAIARSLIELQGGRIWVDSAGPGKGTTFRIALPAAG